MSELYDRIYKDLKDSMKDKNIPKVGILKMLVSEIKNKTINNGKEITDDDCKSVLKKLIKQHVDSIGQFTDCNRMDLVSKEALELTYLKFYMPNMMSEEEMKSEIVNLMKTHNIAAARQNMGQVMKLLRQYDNIDMKMASKYLTSILS